MTQARTNERLRRKSLLESSDAGTDHPEDDEELEEEQDDVTDIVPPSTNSNEDQETPEMLALRLELSTLTTSHASVHSTLQLLQSQLQDLQRVNKELQVCTWIL